jgi:hypothetical protein
MASKMRSNGRSKTAYFIQIPNRCLISENFKSLSPFACKLLLDAASQFKGYNNGDLCISWSVMKNRGWRSAATLDKARKELVEKGWLILTRQGGRNRCSLYAISFHKIGNFGSKLDVAPTQQAPNDWLKWKPEINICDT